MPESLLDECYEPILKIAETQSHDAKRAILALAEIFQNKSGWEVPRQPAFIVTKHFVRLIASGYLLTGFDLDKRLDPVFPPRSLAMGYAG